MSRASWRGLAVLLALFAIGHTLGTAAPHATRQSKVRTALTAQGTDGRSGAARRCRSCLAQSVSCAACAVRSLCPALLELCAVQSEGGAPAPTTM